MRFLFLLHTGHMRTFFPPSRHSLLPFLYLSPLFNFILRPFRKLKPLFSHRRGLFSRTCPLFRNQIRNHHLREPRVLGLRVDQNVTQHRRIPILKGQIELRIIFFAFLVHIGRLLRKNPAVPHQLIPLILNLEQSGPLMNGLQLFPGRDEGLEQGPGVLLADPVKIEAEIGGVLVNEEILAIKINFEPFNDFLILNKILEGRSNHRESDPLPPACRWYGESIKGNNELGS